MCTEKRLEVFNMILGDTQLKRHHYSSTHLNIWPNDQTDYCSKTMVMPPFPDLLHCRTNGWYMLNLSPMSPIPVEPAQTLCVLLFIPNSVADDFPYCLLCPSINSISPVWRSCHCQWFLVMVAIDNKVKVGQEGATRGRCEGPNGAGEEVAP